MGDPYSRISVVKRCTSNNRSKDFVAEIAAYTNRKRTTQHAGSRQFIRPQKSGARKLVRKAMRSKYGLFDGMVADMYGLYYLIIRWKNWGGVRMCCGEFYGTPCLWEFKRSRNGTGKLEHDPSFLRALNTGQERHYYAVGDIILLRKGAWSEVCVWAKINNTRKESGMFRLLLILLRGFKQKSYKYGRVILAIKPNGDGTGEVILQTVVFTGGVPMPVGSTQKWAVNYSPTDYELPQDLNGHLEFRGTFDTLEGFADVLTTVLVFGVDVATGGLKKLTQKAAQKVLANQAKKYLVKEITKNVAKALPAATLDFFKTCINEIAKVYDGLDLEFSKTTTDRDQKIRAALSTAQQRKIIIAGLAAFSSTLLTKAVGSTFDQFLPEDELESISEAVLKNALDTSSTVLVSILASLIKAYGEAIDTSGNLNQKKFQGELDKIKQSHVSSFKDVSKSTISKLVDSII